MKNATQQMVSALLVLTKDPQIRMFLQCNDPKALDQAKKALEAAYQEANEVKQTFER